MRVVALAAVASMLGCYQPKIDGCSIRCAPDGEQCPDGFSCETSGFCRPLSGVCDTPPALDNIVKISTGGRHACAITGDQRLLCWGANDRGQVTGRPTTQQLRPHPVVVDGVDWHEVDAGADFTCAIGDLDGAVHVYCWGDNTASQCGVPSSLGPIVEMHEIDEIINPKVIATGAQHSCAVDVTGSLFCWGSNLVGQLGTTDSVAGNRAVPMAVEGPDWTTVSANNETTCAIKNNDGLFCWGSNSRAQLGNGTVPDMSPHATPQQVSGKFDQADPVDVLSVGSAASCVIHQGELQCWGDNVSAEAGQNPNISGEVLSPARIVNGQGAWKDVKMGHEFGCAIDDLGKVLCWGADDPRLGDGNSDPRGATFGPLAERPVVATGLISPGSAFALDAGGSTINEDGFACAIFGDPSGGAVRCWGANDHGQLGDSNPSLVSVATKVSHPGPWSVVRMGGRTGCAIAGPGVENRQTFCWGDNATGQVTPDLAPQFFVDPIHNDRGDEGVDVAIGALHVCALTNAGNTSVSCWGNNSGHALGIANPTGNEEHGTPATSSMTYKSIHASGNMTCVFEDETLSECWGQAAWVNAGGESTTPLQSKDLMTANMIQDRVSLGPDSGCTITMSGANCFGADLSFERGDGTGPIALDRSPTQILKQGNTQLGGILAISEMDSAAQHRCAITASDTFCWGRNTAGQIGGSIGTDAEVARAIDNNPFVAKPPITDFTSPGYLDRSIAAGGDFTCAVSTMSVVECWGNNESQQCTTAGDNNNGKHTKIAVPANLTFKSVVAGTQTACALDVADDIYCWGASKHGETGTGIADRDFAVDVLGPE